jgi:hypothetical protein
LANVPTLRTSSPASALALALFACACSSGSDPGGDPTCTGATCGPPAVIALSVSPATATITAGTGQPYAATAQLSDGSATDVTAEATWSSSNLAVAILEGAAPGEVLARGVAAGTAQVTATLGDLSGTATLTVTAALSAALAVSCEETTLAKGTTGGCVAHEVLGDGTRRDVTAEAAWSSSDPAVAVASAGGVTAVEIGAATIGAAYAGLQGSALVTVSDAVLASIVIEPSAPTLAAGTTAAFAAIGIFSDGTRQGFTAQVTWTTGDGSIATVSAGGVVAAVAAGTTHVRASRGDVFGETALTVVAVTLEEIDVFASATTIARGTSAVLQAIGTWSDGSTQDLSALVTWESDGPAVTVSAADGAILALGTEEGAATVTATLWSVSGALSLAVTGAALTALEIDPGGAISVPEGLTQPLSAVGTFSDGSTQDLTQQASWLSSDPLVASVSNAAGSAGVLAGIAQGTAVVTAMVLGLSASAAVTVTDAVLLDLEISPDVANVPTGYPVQFRAIGSFGDGSTRDVTADATWSSSEPLVATVSNASGTEGLATTLSVGTTTVTASLRGVEGSATLTVGNAKLVSLSVAPNPFAVAVTGTLQLTATGTFTDGTTLDLTDQANWSSSARSVAVVSKQGVVTGIGAGTVRITANRSGKKGYANGEVQ